ncbi:hypothetical protein ACFYWS_21250 [Streptomyces sp. NPDC002795]|uniref:hypothetical protein n=1 Tax=Streptomyces sp. NPDC002795 TaxID=3364665 RepID=UPI00369F2944
MAHIERAQADGVDKGIAVDPTVGRGDRGVDREAGYPADREAGRGMGREADPMVGREVAPGAGREAGYPVDRVADHDVGPERGTRAGRHSGLVPAGEHDALEGRLRHALTGFVDEPRAAVEEADHVLEDLTARLTETLASHRHTLRTSWEDSPEDTERLRQALRDYRETAERLLRL